MARDPFFLVVNPLVLLLVVLYHAPVIKQAPYDRRKLLGLYVACKAHSYAIQWWYLLSTKLSRKPRLSPL